MMVSDKKKNILLTTVLLLNIIGHIRYLFYYRQIGVFDHMSGLVFGIDFHAVRIDRIICFVFGIISAAVIFLYFTVYYRKNKGGILFSTAIITQSLFYLATAIYFLIYVGMGYTDWVGIDICVFNIITGFACAISLILLAIALIMGKNCKIYLMISISICVAVELLNFLNIIYYIEKDCNLYVALTPILFVGRVAFFLLILAAFVLDTEMSKKVNCKSYIIEKFENIKKEKASITVCKKSPTEELALLKEKYELGIIEENEYQEKRKEIISKL